MTSEIDKPNPVDPGLRALVMLLRLHGIGADEGQIRHRFGGQAVGVDEMLRGARELGLKARAIGSHWARLVKTPLPAIAILRDGGFLILGKAATTRCWCSRRSRRGPQ